jgi:hypothetical protein
MRIVTSSLGSVGSGQDDHHKTSHDMVSTGKSYQAKVPRGLRVLSSTRSSASTSTSRELSDLQAEASMIEQWWQEPRWKHTKRIYSGEYSQRRGRSVTE